MPLIKRPEWIYSLLEDESRRRNLPEIYKTDLTNHDRTRLIETETQDFIWVLRTCGTDLIPLDQVSDHERPTYRLDPFRPGVSWSDSLTLFYRYQDGTLREITYEQAKEAAEQALSTYFEMRDLAYRLQRKQAEQF